MARQAKPWRDGAKDDVTPDWDGDSVAGTIGGTSNDYELAQSDDSAV